MLALKYLLMILGVGLFGSSGILVAYDIYIAARLRWLLGQTSGEPRMETVQRKAARPFGRVRCIAARIGVTPQVGDVVLFDIRKQLYMTSVALGTKAGKRP
jgi:hypothetical protein